MSVAHDFNIFKPMQDLTFEHTISHQCGVTMNAASKPAASPR